MRIAIFGLTVSSSWGNGHATTWRGVLKALHRDGHQVTFFERDVPYYAAARDLRAPDFVELVLYEDWSAVAGAARRAVAEAEVAIATSYCPDGLSASRLMLDAGRGARVFYDIDTPVTLAALAQHGVAVPNGARYLTADLIPEFDLYLSFTGGPVLDELRQTWKARRTAPLYCSVDPDSHQPAAPAEQFRCALGYLGTYAVDRQTALEALLFRTAERFPDQRFAVAGSLYPAAIAWPRNVDRCEHLRPAEHASFYCANRLTLNLTRDAMKRIGYSPSVRLFEAAACGTPIITDRWPGIEAFLLPGEEILVVDDADGVAAALEYSDAELAAVAAAARAHTLAAHSGSARARELIAACAAC
ncbi:MAG: glycosyltransferase [Candidatus Binatia bacterium]